MPICRSLIISAILYAISISPSLSQWRPTGELLTVSSKNRCEKTAGRVAAINDGILYFCPARAAEVDAQVSDASHFYIVHEYGHLAIHTTSTKLADCWAAHKLASAPKGPHYIRRWIKHWRIYGTADAAYGTAEERISNVRSCCACGA
jgi:hypothetical protein